MPEVTLLPASAGSYTDGGDVAGTFPTNMQTADGSTSYRWIVNGPASRYDTYLHDALPVAAAVTNVDYRVQENRHASGANVGRNVWNINGGTNTQGATNYTAGSWKLNTDTAISRPGGGSWTPSDFDGATAEGGFSSLGTDATGQMYCSYSVFIVTYSPPAGGWYWLLHLWVPPLLAHVGASLSFSEIVNPLRAIVSKYKKSDEEWLMREAGAKRPVSRNVVPSSREDWEHLKWELTRRPVYGF